MRSGNSASYKVLNTTLRAPEAAILSAFGEPVPGGLRIPTRVASAEIDKRRREIAAFERLRAKDICWGATE